MMRIARTILGPPAADPADPPTNISRRRIVLAWSFQRLKSSVANPAVVMIVTIWKAACRSTVSGAASASTCRVVSASRYSCGGFMLNGSSA